MKRAMLLALATAACTGPVTLETTQSMPTGYLCDILHGDYVTLPSERRAAYGELERRGESCERVPSATNITVKDGQAVR